VSATSRSDSSYRFERPDGLKAKAATTTFGPEAAACKAQQHRGDVPFDAAGPFPRSPTDRHAPPLAGDQRIVTPSAQW
jgi:hypothetical protein